MEELRKGVLHVVIAGNYLQFASWCQEHGITTRSQNVVFASERTLQRIRGVSQVEAHFVGTWFNRPSPELEAIDRAICSINGGYDVNRGR